MMKKEILLEIYRLQEIMNVKKNIINENKFVDLFTELIDDFIAKSSKVVKGAKNFIEVGALKIERKVLQDIQSVLNGTKRFEDLTEDAVRILGRISREIPDVVDGVYERLLLDFFTKSGVKEEDFLKLVASEITQGKSIPMIVRDMNGGVEDVFLETILNNKLLQQVKKYKESIRNKTEFVSDIIYPSPKKQIPRLKQTVKDINYDDLIPSGPNNGMKKFLTSRITIFNEIRVAIQESWEKRLAKYKDLDEKVTSIFEDIKGSFEKITQDIANINSDTIVSEMRGISIKINNLKNELKIETDDFYNEIESKLKEVITDDEGKELIPDFMKKMREEDPYGPGSFFEKSYAWNWWNNTSTSNTVKLIKNIFSGIFKKEVSTLKQIGELVQRAISFVFSGSPKSWKEFQEYTTKYGKKKGYAMLCRDLWIAKHIGMPLFWGTYHTIEQGIKNYYNSYFKDTKLSADTKKAWASEIGQDFVDMYKFNGEDEVTPKSFAWNLITPGHIYFFDLFDFTDPVFQGKKHSDVPINLDSLNADSTTRSTMNDIINNPDSTANAVLDSAQNIIDDNTITPQPVTPSTDDIKSFMISNGMSESDYNVSITSWKFYDIDKTNKTAMVECIKNPSGYAENIVGKSYKIVNVNGDWVWDVNRGYPFKP